MRGESRGEQGGQRRDRAVHQAREARLHVLQHEHAPLGGVLLGLCVSGEMGLGELAGLLLMAALDIGEAGQQLADGHVERLDGGLVVELRRLHLHDFGFLPHLLDAERLAQPDRAALQEPFHVLAPNGRKMLAKAFAIKGIEHGAVPALLLGHFVEHLGGMRIGLPHLVGKGLVDA